MWKLHELQSSSICSRLCVRQRLTCAFVHEPSQLCEVREHSQLLWRKGRRCFPLSVQIWHRACITQVIYADVTDLLVKPAI